MHFFPDDPPENDRPQGAAHESLRSRRQRRQAARFSARRWRCLRALTRLGLPRFAAGLGEDAARYGCPLLGGDTDRTPGPTSVSIAAFGAVPHGKMVRRSTAKAGDCVVVTGTIGDAALGVKLRRDRSLAERWRLTRGDGRAPRATLSLPQPRNALAEAVLHHAAAAMDVSDGLAGDLAKLCRASSVAAEIDVARVPLSDAARAAIAAEPALIETVLTGGDDYEIVADASHRKNSPHSGGGEGGRCRGDRDRAGASRGGRPLQCKAAGRWLSRGPRSAISRDISASVFSRERAEATTSAARSAGTRAAARRYRAGAGGRFSGAGPRSFPSTARSSRRCARPRTAP